MKSKPNNTPASRANLGFPGGPLVRAGSRMDSLKANFDDYGGMRHRPRQIDVPCAGCTACCHRELIVLHPEDGDDLNLLAEHRFEPGIDALVLKHKDDMSCIYLGDDGCTVWKHRPSVCRLFDCRGLFLKLGRAERRRMERKDPSVKEMFDAARSRLPWPDSCPTRRSTG